MDPAHLQELITIERHYWWHVAKRAVVMQTLQKLAPPPPGHVVEGGVGGGQMLKVLQAHGYRVTGFDMFPEAIEHCHQMGLPDVHVHDLEKPWPLPEASVDVVLLLDVLEHLAQPERALGYAAAVLKPGGVALITVPAYPRLMGPWDRMLGHHRRYTSKALAATATQAGLRTLWSSHWNAFTLVPAVLQRLVQSVVQGPPGAEFPRVPGVINGALKVSAKVERLLMQRMRVPVGLSILSVLGRP